MEILHGFTWFNLWACLQLVHTPTGIVMINEWIEGYRMFGYTHAWKQGDYEWRICVDLTWFNSKLPMIPAFVIKLYLIYEAM